MNHFEIVPTDGGFMVQATGITRAGLMTAALKGVFAPMEPQAEAGAMPQERSFDVSVEDPNQLVRVFLEAALEAAKAHREAYDELRFSLITDKKAIGVFIGKSATFQATVTVAKEPAIEIKKNDVGAWETSIPLEAVLPLQEVG